MKTGTETHPPLKAPTGLLTGATVPAATPDVADPASRRMLLVRKRLDAVEGFAIARRRVV